MIVKQLYVAGAGLMGAGIAQTAITRGFDVTIREVEDTLLAKGKLTSVCVTVGEGGFRAIPIPEPLRQKLGGE